MLKLSLLIALVFFQASSQAKKEFKSPNGKVRALVSNVEYSEVPKESDVKILSVKGVVLFDTSFASEDGEHGFGVVRAEWTPDSKFFVFAVSSSGGHQSWHCPTYFYSQEDRKLRRLDDFLGVITTADFQVFSPDSVVTMGRTKGTLEEAKFSIRLSSLIRKRN